MLLEALVGLMFVLNSMQVCQGLVQFFEVDVVERRYVHIPSLGNVVAR